MKRLPVTIEEGRVVTLATDIRREHKAAQIGMSDAVMHARRCGELLLQAKVASGHGHFYKWIETNAPEISKMTAWRFMRLAELTGSNLTRVKDLSLRQALARLPSMKPKKPGNAVSK